MRARLLRLLAVAAVVGLAGAAKATPVLWTMVGGPSCSGAFQNCVTITATDSNGTIFNQPIGLTGSTVTFDDTGHALPGFLFTAGPTAPLPGTGDLTGENIALNSLSIGPALGYTSIFVGGPLLGGAGTYPFTVGPIGASGSITLSGVFPAGPYAFSAPPPPIPSLSGQIQLNFGLTQLSLNGITLGQITGLPPVHSGTVNFPGGTVTIKADIIFTAIPEPGTALLLGVGLAGIAGAVRRRARD